MPYENILFAQDGPVAMITINREKLRNALNGATISEIGAALAEVERDERLRVAIITGAGEKAFAAGADINELRALSSANAAAVLVCGDATTPRESVIPKSVPAACQPVANATPS